MTATMLVIDRLLPGWQRTRLEPRRITDDMLRCTGLKEDLSNKQRIGASLVAHLGYGAAVGSAYPLADPMIPLPRGLRGPAYGLLVWAASYAGWLPAVGTLPAPQHRPAGRNLLLIASHLVWGAATEAVSNQLIGREAARCDSLACAAGSTPAIRKPATHRSAARRRGGSGRSSARSGRRYRSPRRTTRRPRPGPRRQSRCPRTEMDHDVCDR